MKKLLRYCPICGGKEGESFCSLDFVNTDKNPLPIHYEIVACSSCGFSFADMDSSQEKFDQYYHYCNSYAEAEALRYVDSANNPRFFQIVNELIELVPKDAAIVDIGFGGGELLLDLKKQGFTNLFGLDPSERSVDHLRRMGINGIQASLFDNLDMKFDVVVSTAVVEHIFDLNTYVKKLKAYVNEGGYIVIDAPAVEGFSISRAPFADSFNQEHINYFSCISLDNLMGKYGLVRQNDDPYNKEGFEKNELINIYKNVGERQEVVLDQLSTVCIKQYLDIIKKDGDRLVEKVQNILNSKSNIVIFGTGSFTVQLLGKYPDIIPRILFFVDNNTTKQGGCLCGKKIKDPDRIREIESEAMIVICSMRNDEEIKMQLMKMNLENEIVSLAR